MEEKEDSESGMVYSAWWIATCKHMNTTNSRNDEGAKRRQTDVCSFFKNKKNE